MATQNIFFLIIYGILQKYANLTARDFGIVFTRIPNFGLTAFIQKVTKPNLKPNPNQSRNITYAGKLKTAFVNEGKLFDTMHPTVLDKEKNILYSLSSKKDARYLSFPENDRLEYFDETRGQMQFATRTYLKESKPDFFVTRSFIENPDVQRNFEERDLINANNKDSTNIKENKND